MKTSKIRTGEYDVTGYPLSGEMVGYNVARTPTGWTVTLYYGKGARFNQPFKTKAIAVEAIRKQTQE